jgi:peptidoglycan-associated lipoprotein
MSRPSIGSTCQEVLMKWNLAAGLVTVLLVEMHAGPPADACGVKLTVKSSAPRKAIARTSNPSDVLLLGNPPRRLELDLTAAGHRVEVAPSASAAKRKSYAVVVTDAGQQDEARSSFPGAVVIVRSGDVVADTRSVEQQVARKPVRTEEARTVLAARPSRTPIAAGPTAAEPRHLVAASEPKEPQPVSAPTPPPPPPERVAAVVPKATEPKVTDITPAPERPRATATPERPRAVAKANTVHDEVYFTLGSFRLEDQASGSLAKAVRWLTDSSDVHVIIEGHADPTGTHDGNLALAQKRAEWVRDYLVSAGIDQSRLDVISYGDTRLRYGRADRRNRRAAIVVK